MRIRGGDRQKATVRSSTAALAVKSADSPADLDATPAEPWPVMRLNETLTNVIARRFMRMEDHRT
jgi:hypothetical protein